MPVSVGQIAANTAEVKIPVGDDFVTVKYAPGQITEETFQQLTSLSKLQNVSEDNIGDISSIFQSLNQMLVDLIKSWDLTEEDGVTVVPLTVERLSGKVAGVAKIPLTFRLQVVGAIMGDMRPNQIAPQTS